MATVKTWNEIVSIASGPYSWPERSCVALASNVAQLYTGVVSSIYRTIMGMGEARAAAFSIRENGSVMQTHNLALTETGMIQVECMTNPCVGMIIFASGIIKTARSGLTVVSGNSRMGGRLITVLPDGTPHVCGDHTLIPVDIRLAKCEAIWMPPHSLPAMGRGWG